MVLYQEVVNILWLVVAVVVLIAGLAVFIFSTTAFFKIAIGIPVFLIGASLGLIKIHELLSVILEPGRTKTMCIFCSRT